MARKSGKVGRSTYSRPMSVWIKRSDLVNKRTRHLYGELKVWGMNLALGKEWVEFKEVKKGKNK